MLKIQSGKTINFPVFVDLLPPDIAVDKDLIFDARREGPKQFRVTVLDGSAFQQLLQRCQLTRADRVAAAMLGDSHQYQTSCGFMLVFHQQLCSIRPDVVVMDQQGVDQGFVSKNILLIIENQESFFAYQQMLPLLSVFYGQPLDLASCDIALGFGQQINRSINLPFLNQYAHILCAFDYDLGALRMVDGLKRGVKSTVDLLQPLAYEPWHRYFVRLPHRDAHLVAAIQLARDLGYEQLADAFVVTTKFLEQEVLLAIES